MNAGSSGLVPIGSNPGTASQPHIYIGGLPIISLYILLSSSLYNWSDLIGTSSFLLGSFQEYVDPLSSHY